LAGFGSAGDGHGCMSTLLIGFFFLFDGSD